MALFACDACDRTYLTGYESLGLRCPYCGGDLRIASRGEAVNHAARAFTSETKEAPPCSKSSPPPSVEPRLAELRQNRQQIREASTKLRAESARLLERSQRLYETSLRTIRESP